MSMETITNDMEFDESTATIAYDDENEMPDSEDLYETAPDSDRESTEQVTEPVVEPDAESDVESDDDNPWVRRSVRGHVAPKRFTYDVLGGNPTMESVNSVMASLDSCKWLR